PLTHPNLGMSNRLYIDKFLVKVLTNILAFKFSINLVITNHDIKLTLHISTCSATKHIQYMYRGYLF
ncbi:hypothetical protein O243_00001, partial [Staphylococcus aureus M0036]